MVKIPFKATQPLAKGVPMTPARRKRLIFSYAPDCRAGHVLSALFFSLDSVEGYRRRFSLEDDTIRYPYAVHERVPNTALFLIAVVAPFCIMPIINIITVRSWWDFHNSSLGLILGLAITGAFTQVVKITVGRPRPDIISRCQPPSGLEDPQYSLTDWTICTQEDVHILRDGFRSFFSGHSSLSFAGLGFLSFYLAGKLHLFDSRGHAGKAWLALSPFMAAALVAISRTMDYRHHWQDVLVGSIVGSAFAYFSYRQYYPDLSSPLSHRPYSPRIKREEDHVGLPTHIANHNPFTHKPADATDPSGNGRYNDSNSNSLDGNSNEDYELEGTVPRPGPGRLEDVWREGSSGAPQASRGLPEASPAPYVPPAAAPIQSPDPTFTPVRPAPPEEPL
ncbi:hypothetical protein NLJ89_g8187 [Agrocybe chaxingu]|uniref:Phosphatidic acid phosphatase type 2/haloperoxidase domain-containing protein n=1 Tax=Agrocybe chaxingu TaxID=84603 RepID=A0A9W8K286_9AGAR|nr:hypothetical protein NLJ89_g8187 [Agrocybe chaxingu]